MEPKHVENPMMLTLLKRQLGSNNQPPASTTQSKGTIISREKVTIGRLTPSQKLRMQNKLQKLICPAVAETKKLFQLQYEK
jgi:hypothetical protein